MEHAEKTRQVFVLAGPNGAGKSTVATVLLPESFGINQFVNADLIAQGLSPFAPYTATIEASRLMLARIYQFVEAGQSFGFETTLASRSYISLLKSAKANGFLVHLIYLWLNSAELAISRVADRVRQGGHDVPPDTIRRRYARGLTNFFNLYLPLADTWVLCDNSTDHLILVADGRQLEEPRIGELNLYGQIRRSIEPPTSST